MAELERKNRPPELSGPLVRIFNLAEQSAKDRGSSMLYPEDILVGILKADCGIGFNTLAGLVDDIHLFKAEVFKEQIREGDAVQSVKPLPHASSTKQLMQSAQRYSQRIKVTYLGSEHIILALPELEGTVAHWLLDKNGVTPERVKWFLSNAGAYDLKE